MKEIKPCPGEQIIPFVLNREGEGQSGTIKGEIRILPQAISVRVDGYGDCGTENGYGCPIYIEHYDGKLSVRLWSDINHEDPTHAVDMEGARETERKGDCCAECGELKKSFMHNCPKAKDMPEIYGCPTCDDSCPECR